MTLARHLMVDFHQMKSFVDDRSCWIAATVSR